MSIETQMQPGTLSKAVTTAEAYISKAKVFWKALPGSIRFAAPIAVLVAGVLAIYLLWGAGESFVSLQVHHNFKTAELKVTVDGWTKHTATLSGTTSRKLFGSRVVGLYSKQLSLRPGHHTIVVSVSAPGYDESRTINADFSKDSDTVLDVSCNHSGVSAALHENAPHSYSSASGAIRSNPTSSLLFTICGSALSAIIGFYVQEFLRSRVRKA